MANEFDILIKFGLSKEKATEAVQELTKVQQAATKTSAEATKQQQSQKEGSANLSKTVEELNRNVVQGTDSTEKNTRANKQNFASIQDVKNAFKGLALEIPGVGRFLALLNPYTAAVAGIAAATAIW